MARAALHRRLTWLVADVVGVVEETSRVRSITLDCPGWERHLPGQHVDVRLTAEDGYQAQRSYSIATPASGTRLTITVELVDDGEVSPYLFEELRPGDKLELRGPIGGYFVWEPGDGGPLQLVAGGSGLVPLMAIIRARPQNEGVVPVRLLASWRTWDEVIYRDELEGLAGDGSGLEVLHTLTRSPPEGWTGPSRRIDHALIAGFAWDPDDNPLCFVCGPTAFVETAASILVDLGHDRTRIKTERFGPTGGSP